MSRLAIHAIRIIVRGFKKGSGHCKRACVDVDIFSEHTVKVLTMDIITLFMHVQSIHTTVWSTDTYTASTVSSCS